MTRIRTLLELAAFAALLLKAAMRETPSSGIQAT